MSDSNPTALQLHEALCAMHRENMESRMETLEEAVKPLPVMASDLNVIKRLIGLITVGMLSTMFAFVWSVIVAASRSQ